MVFPWGAADHCINYKVNFDTDVYVTIDTTNGYKLRISVRGHGGVVVGISPYRLIHVWNRRNPEYGMDVGNRIIRAIDATGIKNMFAELPKRQEMRMWVRSISHVDVCIQAAGVDVGVQRDWISVSVPIQGPVVT